MSLAIPAHFSSTIMSLSPGRTSKDLEILNCKPASKFIVFCITFIIQNRDGSFYGIYHMSLGDPASVYQAFEGFVSRLLDEGANAERTSTEAFLVDPTGNATIKFR